MNINKLLGLNDNNPIIECNKPIQSLEEMKKQISTSHGNTIIALSMIDDNSSGVNLTIKYDDPSYLSNAAEQILSTLSRYNPIRVVILSLERDGNKIQEYTECYLHNGQKYSPEDLKYNSKGTFFADITQTNNKFSMKLARSGENPPRLLTLELKPPLVLQQ